MAQGRDTVKESLLRSDVPLEEALDENALEEVYRRLAEAEANEPDRLADGTAWENALSVDDLRELAERLRRGEQVDLQKP